MHNKNFVLQQEGVEKKSINYFIKRKQKSESWNWDIIID